MTTPATISVITRTLGRPRLAEALASIAAQTLPGVEAVVVDMSGGISAPGIKAHPGRLLHIDVGHPLNRSAALNLGIERASADVIAILDDDNCYEPGHLASLVEGLRATRADLVYSGVQRRTFAPDGQPVHEARIEREFDFAHLVFGNYIYATSVAFTKAIWRAVGGYDTRFPVYEDWDFYIRVGARGRIARVPGFGAISRNFTGTPGSASHADERADVERCQCGIHWKHRKLIARKALGTRADELYKEYPHVAPRGVRRETLKQVAGWWLKGLTT